MTITSPCRLLAQCRRFRQSADYSASCRNSSCRRSACWSWCSILCVDEEKSQKTLGLIAFVGTLAGLARRPGTWRSLPDLAFSNMVRVDSFSVFFHFLVIAIAAVVILSSFEYMAVQRIRAGEYYALILFGAVGMCLMSSAVELVLIFIALEISSISTYILAGFRRNEASSSESSLKYFLLGSFATAFFLYGVALMFGATGSTNIDVDQPEPAVRQPVPVAGLCGDGPDVRRPGLQSCCRAVSCLDARRLRRRARSGRRASCRPRPKPRRSRFCCASCSNQCARDASG